MRRLRGAVLVLVGGLFASCTFSDGRGFARIEATLDVGFAGLEEEHGRLTPDGWVKTDTGYELELTSLELEVCHVAVLGTPEGTGGTAAGAQGCSFDPAHPPAGCTLCHGGHCHCDGELKSYEELEAELCGGGDATGLATIAAVPVEQALELATGPKTVTLGACEPTCEIGAGSLERVEVVLDGIRAAGRVRDGSAEERLGGADVPFVIEIPLEGLAIKATLDSPVIVGRDEPHEVSLTLELHMTDALFDGIAWHELGREAGTISVSGSANATGGERLVENLGGSHLNVVATRGAE